MCHYILVWCTPVFIFHWFLLLSRLCEPFCKKRDGTREFQGRKRDRFSTISHLLSILHLSGIIFQCHCQGCKRLGDPRGAEVAVQVVFISRMLTIQFFGRTDVYDINNVDNADDVDDSDDDDNPIPGAWLPISSM